MWCMYLYLVLVPVPIHTPEYFNKTRYQSNNLDFYISPPIIKTQELTQIFELFLQSEIRTVQHNVFYCTVQCVSYKIFICTHSVLYKVFAPYIVVHYTTFHIVHIVLYNVTCCTVQNVVPYNVTHCTAHCFCTTFRTVQHCVLYKGFVCTHCVV